jgi:mRNA interferase YafQ
MKTYKTVFSKLGEKKLGKILKKTPILKASIDKSLKKLIEDPFQPSLKTHKIDSRKFGLKYSSRITADLRLIWNFKEGSERLEIIQIFDVGGHSGGFAVYEKPRVIYVTSSSFPSSLGKGSYR